MLLGIYNEPEGLHFFVAFFGAKFRFNWRMSLDDLYLLNWFMSLNQLPSLDFELTYNTQWRLRCIIEPPILKKFLLSCCEYPQCQL